MAIDSRCARAWSGKEMNTRQRGGIVPQAARLEVVVAFNWIRSMSHGEPDSEMSLPLQ